MIRQSIARGAGEFGKRVEGEIHFAGGAAILVAVNFFEEFGGKIFGVEHFDESEIGINAGRNDFGVDFFAGFENDSGGAAVACENFRDWSFHADFGAGFASGVADGVGDCAGAAAAESPGAKCAVDFAHVMVKKNVGGSGRAHAEKSADDSGGGHGGFENVGLEPLVEEIGGGHGHELDEIVFFFGGEGLEATSEKSEFAQASGIERSGIGRRHRKERFDEAAHLDHFLAEFVVGFGVEAGVADEFAAGFGVVVDAPEMVAIGHGRESAVERKDFEAVAREVEVANDFGAQKRDDVRADGELESGDDFFGDGGAAEDVAAFEDEDFFVGAGEIGRVGQAVVASADDDCVVGFGHEQIETVLQRLKPPSRR